MQLSVYMWSVRVTLCAACSFKLLRLVMYFNILSAWWNRARLVIAYQLTQIMMVSHLPVISHDMIAVAKVFSVSCAV